MKTLISLLIILSLSACASGSAIVTGYTRQPIEFNLVKLYLEEPTQFEVIGIVNASSDAGFTEQGSMDYAIEELKKQAAKLGANGVLLTTTGQTQSTSVGSYGNGLIFSIPTTTKTVSGKAIYVK
jgi:hypothetical protein